MTAPRDAPLRNELDRETSPYLLQHAHQPVHWQPWGERAFALARELDRPVFLSIGYSACHWCHVMARDSFDDPATAALLNEHFVSVKVDREERPDVDDLYMTVCRLMTGSGGWPLTLILTPGRRAFFAATFLPRESRSGRMGLKELLPGMSEIWRTRRKAVLETAERVGSALADLETDTPTPSGDDVASADDSGAGGPDLAGAAVLDAAREALSARFDAEHGGFGGAPKFPAPHQLLFLLREHARTGDARALTMVADTLRALRRGGIYDQLGHGLHRYSTDERWLLPHFEKMLHDQALLALAALEAHQATGAPEFADLAREVFDFVRRELTAPDGTFFTALDADSEGREGRFYVWTQEELDAILGPEDAALAARCFGVRPEGNFLDEASGRPTGRNVLHLPLPMEELAWSAELKPEVLAARLEDIRKRLLAAREGRVRPGLDHKVLTDLNGLMIAALARGARVLGDDALRERADRAADALLAAHLRPEGLAHCLRGEAEPAPGLLDDHAFLAWGLLELHEAGLEPRRLEQVRMLTRALRERFEDRERGGFFLTPEELRELPLRRKDAYDGATPSGNSAAAWVLLRLGVLDGDAASRESGLNVLRPHAAVLRGQPEGFTALLCALEEALRPSLRVALPTTPSAREPFLAALRTAYLPNAVLTVREDAEGPATTPPSESGGAAQVCAGERCLPPVRTPPELLRLLTGGSPSRRAARRTPAR